MRLEVGASRFRFLYHNGLRNVSISVPGRKFILAPEALAYLWYFCGRTVHLQIPWFDLGDA